MKLDKNTISKLERGGFLRSKFHDYATINERFKEVSKDNGYCKAVEIIANDINKTERTVSRAIKSFKDMEK